MGATAALLATLAGCGEVRPAADVGPGGLPARDPAAIASLRELADRGLAALKREDFAAHERLRVRIDRAGDAEIERLAQAEQRAQAMDLDARARGLRAAQEEVMELMATFAGALSPFERAAELLPRRRPPLFVEQVLTYRDPPSVVVRPQAHRFLCGRSLTQRRTAVREYFAAARRRLGSAGEDIRLVVAPLTRSTEILPLAVADDEGVRLTSRGRATGDCR